MTMSASIKRVVAVVNSPLVPTLALAAAMNEDNVDEYRFNVFGTMVAIVGATGQWQAFFLGTEGKRRAADFIVPVDLTADELQQYLGDLFHENATPRDNDVRRLA